MTLRALALASALTLCLSACESNSNRYVATRRDPAQMAERARRDSLDPAELDIEAWQLKQDTLLSREWQLKLDREARQRARIRALTSVGQDPWRDYEVDRRAVLYRDWSDVYGRPPALIPENSGPPGWIGPYAAGAEPTPAGGGFVEGPAPEPVGEGDEGGDGWDDGAGDEDDDPFDE